MCIILSNYFIRQSFILSVLLIFSSILFSCYDKNEGMPSICYKLNRNVLQIGDTLSLEDCSTCERITIEWGDGSFSNYIYYDYNFSFSTLSPF